jgi:hypothetical protein
MQDEKTHEYFTQERDKEWKTKQIIYSYTQKQHMRLRKKLMQKATGISTLVGYLTPPYLLFRLHGVCMTVKNE